MLTGGFEYVQSFSIRSLIFPFEKISNDIEECCLALSSTRTMMITHGHTSMIVMMIRQCYQAITTINSERLGL